MKQTHCRAGRGLAGGSDERWTVGSVRWQTLAEDVMAELEAAVRGMARAEEPLEADVGRPHAASALSHAQGDGALRPGIGLRCAQGNGLRCAQGIGR